MATKLKGKGLSLKIDDVDYRVDLMSIELKNEEADDDATTFADLDDGGAYQYYLEGEAVADYSGDDLHSLLWSNAGDTDIPFVFAPLGNETPSATQPHWTGTLNFGQRPTIGGTANETFTFEFRLDINGVPNKLVA